MQFSLATVLALATAVVAQTPNFNPIIKPTEGEKVPAGSTYEIVWQPSADRPGTIAIDLLGGATPGTLDVVDAIAAGIDGAAGTYSWTVDEELGDLATYGIMITLESDPLIFQYGFPFQITGGGASSSSSASGTASATATESETETSASATKTASVSSTRSSISTASSATTTLISSTIVSSSIRSNLSTTATGSHTTITSLVTQQPSGTQTATSTLATNGVATVAAGGFAMLGGVAMALLAL